MLVNTHEMLKHADQKRYAVGGFNITTLETAMAIVEAAEQERSPVILQITEKTIDYMGIDIAFVISKTLADRSPMPVAIHLDHGRNFEIAAQALKLGFTSIMIDVSHLASDERIRIVKDFAQKAHRVGASIEAEEDQIGGKEDYVVGDKSHFTDPQRAALFVAQTCCDSFAVSIGSSHGKPVPGETLDIELLSQINRTVGVPLVLHGASSTPEKLTREAIGSGICKINIDTDLRIAFSRELRATLENKKMYDPREELAPSTEEVKEVVIEKIKLFGSNGQY